MNILIIGGTHYVGITLIKELIKSNNFKNIFTLSKHHNPSEEVKHFVTDRKNIKQLEQIIKESKPNVIIDMICFDKEDSGNLIRLHRNGHLNQVNHI